MTSIAFKNKPELLIIQRHFTAGGASVYTCRLIQELLQEYQVHLWILGASDAISLQAIPPAVQVRHIPLPKEAHRGHHRYWQFTSALQTLKASALPTQEFAIVLGICLFPGYLTALLFTQIPAHQKYLLMLDEALIDFPRFHPHLQHLIQLCLSQITALVSVSQDLLNATQAVLPVSIQKPGHVLAPLLDTEFIEAAQAAKLLTTPNNTTRPLKIFTAARLVPGKNILRCLEIHQELQKQGLRFIWEIAGTGPQAKQIRKQIEALGLQESFILLGHCSDVANRMSNADLFVLLSDSEGCPTVVIEALTCACPVVSTPVHGVRRYIQNGINGALVSFDFADQVDRLQALLDNRKQLLAMKNHLKKHPPVIDHDLPLFMNALQSAVHPPPSTEHLPQVIIAIPTYNQAHYIDQAISSALMQSYENLSVYVLDDCSTDDTAKQIQKWLSDPRLHYIRHPHNIGRCANYRYAVNELPESEWMMILDGDDYYTDPNFIQEALSLSTQHERVVFIQAGHTPYHEAQAACGPATLPQIKGEHQWVSGLRYVQHWFETGFFTHLGILFKRAPARACQMYQANISSSDMESFLRLAREGLILLMKKSVGHWRQHSENTSRQLQLEDVAANVQIFRAISQQWVADGLAQLSDFEPHLTRYQARTYAYLYQQAMQNARITQSYSPWDLIRSIWDVHPRLFTQRKIIKLLFKASWQYFRHPARLNRRQQ